MDADTAKRIWDFSIAIGGAMIGTAVGAGMAFWLERRKRAVETEDRHVEAANVAIFNLSQIYSYLIEYRTRIINPHRPGADYWWQISRMDLPPPNLQSFDPRSLSFLFETEHRTIPALVALHFANFAGHITHISKAREANAKIQDLCSSTSPPKNFVEVEILIGPVFKATVAGYVDAVIDYNQRLLGDVNRDGRALRDAVKSLYPHRSIILFVSSDTREEVREPWWTRPPQS